MLGAFCFPPPGFGNCLRSGICFPSFFAPMSCYPISSLQKCPIGFFAGKFAVCQPSQQLILRSVVRAYLQLQSSLSIAQVSLQVLLNAQGTLSGRHYCCLGFLEPVLSPPGCYLWCICSIPLCTSSAFSLAGALRAPVPGIALGKEDMGVAA